jgi:putative redox protein
MTATIIYTGQLRCHATHNQSGSVIETDAPTDNRGKGERFSPTDLLCVSLGTCIVTTMGIKATDMGTDLTGTTLQVQKHMLADPRRVGRIEVEIGFPASLRLEEKDRVILQRVGDNCPVMKSIHPDLEVTIVYNWDTVNEKENSF